MTREESLPGPWSDDALQETDIAGRREFVQAVAARIDECVDGQGSTVFGLVGPWGSGKTTLLKHVVADLDDWEVAWFTPWSASDVESITAEFVSALAQAFPPKSRLRKRLLSYARFGAPTLKLIPVMGDVAASLAKDAVDALAKNPPWHAEFTSLSAEIADQHKRVLVIVDDVDRLDGEELRSLLRVVRLLGRFENVHYLLAYDQATIERSLEFVGAAGQSSDFMEKIVQYPFEVPAPPAVVRRRWSRQILDTVSPGAAFGTAFLEVRETFIRLLAMALETPRSARRLQEQLQSLGRLIDAAEVDPLDFVCLTWLRITHHDVWDYIRSNPEHMTAWRERDTREDKQARVDEIVRHVRSGNPHPVRELVGFVFERGGLEDLLAGRRWRAQDRRYFDRYFQIAIADDDVSELAIERTVNQLAADEEAAADVSALREIILGDDEERSVLALDVGLSARRQEFQTSVSLLRFLSDINSELEAQSKVHPARLSSASQWLTRELFTSLESKLMPHANLIETFGYSRLADSAFSARRARGHEEDKMKVLYAPVVDQWLDAIRDEELGSVLARPELLSMTVLSIWTDRPSGRGFLAERLSSSLSLVQIASAYVSYNEWVGRGVHYDAVFREQEFRYAIGEEVPAPVAEGVPMPSDSPVEEVTDLASRSLTEQQKHEFAIRALHQTDLI
ncbi:P-loop NTPase fold protein [Marisediminicola sp. LYQ85]|uniref:P-loop NTPase fold protein n=1 Tax=Marisediminicola sp. LYQ85 TaxID=3391062 RepID=UPI003982F6C7